MVMRFNWKWTALLTFPSGIIAGTKVRQTAITTWLLLAKAKATINIPVGTRNSRLSGRVEVIHLITFNYLFIQLRKCNPSKAFFVLTWSGGLLQLKNALCQNTSCRNDLFSKSLFFHHFSSEAVMYIDMVLVAFFFPAFLLLNLDHMFWVAFHKHRTMFVEFWPISLDKNCCN